MTLLRLTLCASLALLAACQSAAEAPCLIQRPPLGGYTMKFTLEGTPPAGLRDAPSAHLRGQLAARRLLPTAPST